MFNESDGYNPQETESVRYESQFGDLELIEQQLRETEDGQIDFLGSVDEVLVNIPDHMNHVELVRLVKDRIPTNSVRPAIIHTDRYGDILAIWKPHSGENRELLAKLSIGVLYPQEEAAYRISSHFGFDIIPPTVVRQIRGEIGSLQQFVSHDLYSMVGTLIDDTDSEPKLIDHALGIIDKSSDCYDMAALDFILANPDRNIGNWMYRNKFDDNETRLVAIDHGICLSTHDYIYTFKIPQGPHFTLTYEPQSSFDRNGNSIGIGTRRRVEIPIGTLTKLQRGLATEESIREVLTLTGVDPRELDYMFQRARMLVKEGVFLSKLNCDRVTTSKDGEHVHPPFKK